MMSNRSVEFKKRFIAGTCLFMLLALGLTLNLNAQEKDVDPFKEKSGESSWGSDDENKSDKWSDQAGVIDKGAKITSGGLDCPTIVVGKSVYRTDNLAKNLELKTDLKFPNNPDTALGSDGKYFAISIREKVGKDSIENIAVFDTTTGKQTCLIDGVLDKHLIHLRITRNEYVVTGYYGEKAILNVYKASDGSLVKTIELSEKASLGKVLDFSKDGHYLATVIDKEMVVYKVGSSKIVATMEQPSFSDEHAEPDRSRSHSNDHVFIYAWTQHVKFSPDGEELLAFSKHGGERVMRWSKKAKLLTHRRFRPTPGAYDDDMPIEWFPDQNLVMMGGNIMDLNSGMIVWAASAGFASKNEFFIHDQNTLIGRLTGAQAKLQKITIPWEEIKKGLAAMEQQVPAHIAPYQPVDIKIELGNTRGIAGVAKDKIKDGLVKRLASSGMSYEAGAEHYFRLRLTETAGETLPIHEQTSRFSFRNRGRDTGRKATLAKGELVIEYFPKGERKPMWNQVIKSESGTSYRTEINQKTIRDSMLSRLQRQISGLKFPYFIPVDESIPSLPVIVK